MHTQLRRWVALGVVLLAAQALAWPHVNRIIASPVYHRWVYLSAGWHSFNTTALSAGADPIVRVWGPLYSGSTYIGDGELGHDDDSGGGTDAYLWVYLPFANWVQVIVHAEHGGVGGTGNLVQDGTTVLATGATFSGNRLGAGGAYGATTTYETALAPGGPADTVLYGMACDGTMLRWDDNSGVGLAARIASTASICYVILSSGTQPAGFAFVYLNDWGTDTDGDGLGRALENELGTCDGNSLAYCSMVFNTKDSDRDGLSDTAEICGVDDPSFPQHLPRWGANPRHKDVFVEIDYTTDFTSQPFTGADAATAQALFNTGSAADLDNPDGLPGVKLHLDIGVATAAGGDVTLYGNWGGSGQSSDPSYPSAADSQRAVVRRGLFRYALAGLGDGGGQGWMPGDRLGWGVRTWERYVASFAHELGHNLNLGHEGHHTWGSMNCKPTYRSLMNYAFLGGQFSLGANTTAVNPASSYEASGTGGDASYLAGNPFFLTATPTQVDWNRDQLINTWVRSPLTWATWVGCDAMTANYQNLLDGPFYGATPDLVKLNDRLYAFYTGADERIRYRQGVVSGRDWRGSCPGGSTVGATCMTWGPEVTVPTAANARGVSALQFGSGVMLSFRTAINSIRVLHSTTVDASGNLTGWSPDTWMGSNTTQEPELSLMYVDPARFGVSQVAALFASEAGQHRWYTATALGGAWTAQGQVLRTDGTAVSGNIAPGVVHWPNRGAGVSHASIGTACGAFPEGVNNDIGFYCYDKPSHRFTRVNALRAGTQVNRKPTLAYHTFRNDSGLPLNGDTVRGQFWMVTVGGNAPTVWISDPLDASRPPATSTDFRSWGAVGNAWTNLMPGAGMSIYEDLDLAAMKGLWAFDKGGGQAYFQFFPLFDGTPWATLRDGNDFRVMERGICRGIKDDAYCGSSGRWGY
ncbi:hypothetical protein [Pyxidicoccus xibeiensis]|uniref:hypothetical protein n=1 Tax=Pyxidicoccus xibeiensis TaxID=2906759 RepID=UPI0020A7542C|nr:hypothetical protein [Pyxidicoccus xibeiensis]MCP3136152.1 hypothetical protein [Pyxidicoccus xibeiensis]